jgi:glycosyltransferase involved in cell wall biosynthesis
LVSVVIPTYRHRDFVLLALESVWAQTFTDYEAIVVNDGSPDDTDELLRPLADAGRIRYLRQENAGQAAARNRGIEAARGEFVALLDDDDLWPADKLAWQVAEMRRDPQLAVVYGRAGCIDADGKETLPRDANGEPIVLPWETPCGDVLDAFIRQNWILSPGQCLVRTAALRRLSEWPPFDPDPALRGCDDWDLWCRLAEQGPFLFQDRVALRYRFHPGNASRNVLQMHRATLRFYRKRSAGGRSRGRDRLIRDSYRSALGWSAHDLLARARADRLGVGGAMDPAAALQKLVFLARTQPRFLLRPSFVRSMLGAGRAILRQQRERGRRKAIAGG